MKKSLLALAALGAFAGVAHAQSSVTLYGIVDVGINMNTNAGGSHKYDMSSGVMQGSRFGLRGTEDLGGGLKAICNPPQEFSLSVRIPEGLFRQLKMYAVDRAAGGSRVQTTIR